MTDAQVGVTITIPRRGLAEGKSKIHVAAAGFSGEACLVGTRELLAKLGTPDNLQATQEMYAPPLDQSVDIGG